MDDFKKNIKKLSTYIENIEKQTESLPKLRRMLEISQVQEIIVDNFPSQSTFINSICERMNEGLKMFSDSVGEVESIEQPYNRDSYIVTITGATGSFQEISNYNGVSEAENIWKYQSLNLYEEYLDKNRTIDFIKSFFSEIGANENNKEFEELLDIKELFKSDISDHSAFGSKIRNVILHFKGILKKVAQISRNEQPSKKKLSWPKMAEAIVLNSSSNRVKSEFSQLGRQWTIMHSRLSEILKDYSIANKNDLINLSTEMIALIEAFIEIIDREKIKNAI